MDLCHDSWRPLTDQDSFLSLAALPAEGIIWLTGRCSQLFVSDEIGKLINQRKVWVARIHMNSMSHRTAGEELGWFRFVFVHQDRTVKDICRINC